MDINSIARIVNDFTNKKGWWEDRQETRIPRLVEWMKEESDEILQAWIYHGHSEYTSLDSEGLIKPEGLAFELADIIMIALDIGSQFGLDIDSAIDRKMAYNKIRKYKRDYKGMLLNENNGKVEEN